jgi:hypothetical protein
MSAGSTENALFDVTIPKAAEVFEGMIVAERHVHSNYRSTGNDQFLGTILLSDRATEHCETGVVYWGAFAFLGYASGSNKAERISAELWDEIVTRIAREQGKLVIPFPDSHLATLARIAGIWRRGKFALLLLVLGMIIIALAIRFRI